MVDFTVLFNTNIIRLCHGLTPKKKKKKKKMTYYSCDVIVCLCYYYLMWLKRGKKHYNKKGMYKYKVNYWIFPSKKKTVGYLCQVSCSLNKITHSSVLFKNVLNSNNFFSPLYIFTLKKKKKKNYWMYSSSQKKKEYLM